MRVFIGGLALGWFAMNILLAVWGIRRGKNLHWHLALDLPVSCGIAAWGLLSR